ncbi:zinc-ribbon domain-containing protein [Methanobrevibacter sp. OttesenSCG-928-I08]|nr:zinc-ribbon domain-containing protein [Methanobrevibacter sp. OttesenSCG-928-I08]
MKVCPKCGSKNPDGFTYCNNCGNEIIAKKNNSIAKISIILILTIIVIVGGALAYIIYFDTSPIEYSYLNQKDSGNILNNNALSSHIPNSDEVLEITNMANNGVPVYQIGDGSGPVSVIVSGVHGDQLSSQIASLQLIDYLSGRKITGTVYIIPYAAPGAISENVKLSNGVNLNTVADEEGTTSNDIIKFIISKNASAVGDFHGTELGKDPGKTTIMCSQIPCYDSYLLALEMSNYINQNTISYLVAGVKYDGAIEDEANLIGIPSVTPLVLSTHGQVSNGAVEESFLQMLALLHANGNLDPNNEYNRLANMDIDVS